MDALVNVTIPVFGIVLTGYVAGRLGLLGEASASAVNAFVYYFSLPALLILFTARSSIGEIANFPFILVFLFGSISAALIAVVIGKYVFKIDRGRLVVHSLVSGFSNSAYMGIPVFLMAFGVNGTLPAIIATIVGNTLLIGAGIVFLEFNRRDRVSGLRAMRRTSRSLISSPLVMAPILGLLIAASGWKIPTPAANYLELLGNAAGPSALFALGLALSAQVLRIAWREVVGMSVIKLLIQPLTTFALITFVFPLEEPWFEAALILAAMPTGAVAYVVAQQYDTYAPEASAAIVLSTALSVITLSAMLIILGLP